MFPLGLGTWGTPGIPLWSPRCCPDGPSAAGGRAFNGSAFQVWVIANKVQGSHSLSRGTVCHRTGVQPHEPKGQGWDYGIGVSRAGKGGCAGREYVVTLCVLRASGALLAGTCHRVGGMPQAEPLGGP